MFVIVIVTLLVVVVVVVVVVGNIMVAYVICVGIMTLVVGMTAVLLETVVRFWQ